MGFRIHAEPNPQPIPLIRETCWDEVVKELLGKEYDYYNVWFNTGKTDKLTAERIQFLLDELSEAKKKLLESHGLEITEERYDWNYENGDDSDSLLPRSYNMVVTFLKQTLDNNYLHSY